uniref:ADAMTS like 1 n=1 Tax=Oreochromis niloticus TaxID=8128 RepID=A0A669CNS1_ORENI
VSSGKGIEKSEAEGNCLDLNTTIDITILPDSGGIINKPFPTSTSSRTARSEEDRDTLWDAWGSWSECSRTCGGGASYSLRRCLSSKTCEGQNIKYRTCSNVDCPSDAGDFRAQQCSAHADEQYQDQYHEWLPVYNDPDNPCALKCKAKGSGLVVELAPKVLDGTRCYTESLDMCISGICQIVGCDHELGSTATEDNCGVCNGDGSSCRLVRGHYKSQHSSGKTEDTVVTIPYKSRHMRLILKGPDHLYMESKTLHGVRDELVLDRSGQYYIENTTVDYQKLSDKEVLRITGPLGADFTVKVQFTGGTDSVVQYIYYQPIIHRWRETDFFPCSVTCGGGYQLTSAECYDLRSGRVVVDQYCHYYPENVKPKPKLQECNMELCLDSDGYKEIMPYDQYHPLPRWESSPWTSCSTSCGGGIQSRSVSCVEEDMQGTITPTEEWKCLYSPKTAVLQPCNTFDCPTWLAQEWSPCTVTCGQGLRYRVVLCIDHRGLHAGGCNPTTKPHIKEECLVTVPCYKSKVEAKPVWHKQAIELEEEVTASEEPAFIPGPWQPCSRTCGAGTQHRTVKCQVLLSFSQTIVDVPDDECEGVKPATSQPCYSSPCSVDLGEGRTLQREELHDWEYEGFTQCSESCGGGVQEAVVICLNKQTREAADHSLCVSSRRPPRLLQDCKTQPCPPRWETGEWSSCSATCGVGLMIRTVVCTHRPSRDSNHTLVLRDEDCQNPKPSPVQACNRFDCPPMWDTHDWGQCSQSCGGGVQRRQVLCKQRLADGSILELPDTFCPTKSPTSQQPCGEQECPPEWVTTRWSQCSVTCGNGIQTLQAVCRKKEVNGRYLTADPKNCSLLARPSRIQPCFFKPCEKPKEKGPDATILAQRKVYVQWRKGKKVHLGIGGYAYILPWTTVVLRCPTRHFRKGQIHWLKEGKPLVNLPHLSITSLGYVKIHQVRASDAGIYTCVAGEAQEHLVLQIIGSKQKLSVAESMLRRQKVGRPDAISAQERFQELHISLNRYDTIIERLLNHKESIRDEKYIADKSPASEKNSSTLEDEGSEIYIPEVLVADTRRLEEIMKNFSEDLGGLREEQLIAQLLSELTVAQGETNESTLHPPESAESSTQEPLHYKPNIKAHTARPRNPLIIQRSKKIGEGPQSEMIVYIACLCVGRVGLLPTGSLRIQYPSKGDEGLYTCTARNRFGRTSLSSSVQITGKVYRSVSFDGLYRSSTFVQFKLLWRADAWSPCLATCGGGAQTRIVRCMKGPEGRSEEVESPNCLGTGRKPSDARPCNLLPCARWATTSWGPVSQDIIVHKLVFTRFYHKNTVCSFFRPSSLRNCTAEACALQWLVGPWTQCTATCGRHGFQSRQVTCVHLRTGKAFRDRHCTWRPRPASWQRCNILSCGRECRDSTRYCEKVRQLELCLLPQFKSRCCFSCRNT